MFTRLFSFALAMMMTMSAGGAAMQKIGAASDPETAKLATAINNLLNEEEPEEEAELCIGKWNGVRFIQDEKTIPLKQDQCSVTFTDDFKGNYQLLDVHVDFTWEDVTEAFKESAEATDIVKAYFMTDGNEDAGCFIINEEEEGVWLFGSVVVFFERDVLPIVGTWNGTIGKFGETPRSLNEGEWEFVFSADGKGALTADGVKKELTWVDYADILEQIDHEGIEYAYGITFEDGKESILQISEEGQLMYGDDEVFVLFEKVQEANQIVGKWNGTDLYSDKHTKLDQGDITATFNADGTGKLVITDNEYDLRWHSTVVPDDQSKFLEGYEVIITDSQIAYIEPDGKLTVNITDSAFVVFTKE